MDIDPGVRQRLVARFGEPARAWLEEFPRRVGELAERWHLDLGTPLPRGSVAVVVHCRTREGRPAVLKVTPDRRRLISEAAALVRWTTSRHTPAVFAVDEDAGALLMEEIRPGTALVDSGVCPTVEDTAALIGALRGSAVPDGSFPLLADRVSYLFEASTTIYERSPETVRLVPPELYERGRRLAERLVGGTTPAGVLHGDLTPRNILDGGPGRGLVAIDPAPCLGDDPTFDAVDLVLWQATDLATIEDRATRLAAALDADPDRALAWCAAFAAMVALELAESPDRPEDRFAALLALAATAA
jgi:streptomycin 6-kinase